MELAIALEALRNGIEGLKAVQPGMLRHRLEQVILDPMSQFALAERSIEQALRAAKGRGA